MEKEGLAEIMRYLQAQGCHNINLVNPTHVLPQTLEALPIAIETGLSIPLICNTGGYDSIETLKLLDDIIDIYMPDMKYADEETSFRCSGAHNYPTINQAAIKEMQHMNSRQCHAQLQ